MTVAEYLRRKKNLKETPFRISEKGEGFYLVDGAEIPAKEFEKENALPVSLTEYTKDNSDKRHDWLRT